MKSNDFFTPAYTNQYRYAGWFALAGFVLSLIGGVWFVTESGYAGALLQGTAPMWVIGVMVVTAAIVFASLWLASIAFEKAGSKLGSYVLPIGALLLLAVGQLWRFVM
jgi:hypothetical protein